ncbi:MAG: TIGR02452 family protein [Gemmatimonadota bacterium]
MTHQPAKDSEEPKEAFNWQIPRYVAIDLGVEATWIMEDGQYQSASGRTVEIAPLLEAATAGTETYPPILPMPERHTASERDQGPADTVIEVKNETTLSAGKRLLEDGHHPAVLNFASATHPGGGFLLGARAQEEYLARSSGLFACLEGNPMYDFHREQGDPLHTDYVIYSPGVPIFRDDSGSLLEEPYPLGVITSPAVNAYSLPPDRHHEIEAAMRARIRKVLLVALLHGHDAIVLGAWGCGAFENDPRMMAELFKASIEEDVPGRYKKIVFAIVDTWPDQRTIGPFREVFGVE